MAVRNFYLVADIDGRKEALTGGPRSKDGGMYIRVNARKNGASVSACTIVCYFDPDTGTLKVNVFGAAGIKRVYQFESER